MKKGDAAAALEDFKGADALVGVTSTGLAVGQALEKLGRLVEARDKLLEVARIAAKPGESQQIRDARTEADKLQARIAERIPAIKFELTGLPAAVSPVVSIDGEAMLPATLSLPRKVNPGKHAIAGHAEGYQEVQVDVSVAEREQKTAALAFVPIPKTPAVAPAPLPKVSPTPAPHPEPAASKGGFSTWFWAGLGVAGGGLVAGSVTGALSLTKVADIKSRCVENLCPDAEQTNIDSAKLLAHVSTGAFALGGVGLALLGYGLYDSGVFGGKDAHAGLKVEPVVGLGSFALRGTF